MKDWQVMTGHNKIVILYQDLIHLLIINHSFEQQEHVELIFSFPYPERHIIFYEGILCLWCLFDKYYSGFRYEICTPGYSFLNLMKTLSKRFQSYTLYLLWLEHFFFKFISASGKSKGDTFYNHLVISGTIIAFIHNGFFGLCFSQESIQTF